MIRIRIIIDWRPSLNYRQTRILTVNIPKEINRFCPKCNKHTIQKISIYKAGKRRGTAAEKEGMHYEKKGMEDKNSPNLQSQQKQQRRLHRFLHAQNVRRNL